MAKNFCNQSQGIIFSHNYIFCWRPSFFFAKVIPEHNRRGYALQENIYIIRNRRIDLSDLHTIRQFVKTHWVKGRSFISRQLCEHWNWRQPNGFLKDQACRALLLKLEQKGEIQLPPPLIKRRVRGKNKPPLHPVSSYDQSPMNGPIELFGALKLKMVR